MSEEIVTWARVRDGEIQGIYGNKEGAKIAAESFGGTVVKLTGEMPRVPIERKTVAWVSWTNSFDNGSHLSRLGIYNISPIKTNSCKTKVEIIVREVSDE